MASAKLIKNLERLGFEFEYPAYESFNEMIIEILKENDSRLKPALTWLLTNFNYENLKKELNKKELEELNNIIIICNEIYKERGINSELPKIIKKYNISNSNWQKEYGYYFERLDTAFKNLEKKQFQEIEEMTEIRTKFPMSEALSTLFKPGKLKIMEKIFNYQPLTNTEFYYYYRSIRPTILACMNKKALEYMEFIERMKKIREEKNE